MKKARVWRREDQVDFEQYLMGGAPLSDFLDRVSNYAVTSEPREELVQAWRGASEAYGELAEREAGCADDIGVLPLAEGMQAHLEAVMSEPAVHNAFGEVPVAFGLLEADALMAGHYWIDERREREATGRASRISDDADLIRTCLPAGDDWFQPEPLVRLVQGELCVIGRDADIELIDAAMVVPPAGEAGQVPGNLVGTLSFSIGRRPPLMHVAMHAGRALLLEGRHRALALRQAGWTFLPCLISTCSTLDEVALVSTGISADYAANCFEAKRPPMLRDFGRPALVHRYEKRSTRQVLRIRYEVLQETIPWSR
jgi:hypothetical protein